MPAYLMHQFFTQSRPGHVWAVQKGPFTHLGIETFSGSIIAMSPTTKGVKETTKVVFAGNQTPEYIGYPGRLTPWEVESRAYSQIGKPYSFWKDNCEHFVAFAHGKDKRSPQLRLWGSIAAILMLALFAYSKSRSA